MTTPAANPSSSGSTEPAPWRSLFLEHINSMPSPEFSLSTVRKVVRRRHQNTTNSENSVVTPSPRVRTCIYRGLWADMPVNPKNEAELNPGGVYTSDLPVFTTDVRMDKMVELFGLETDNEHGAAAAAAEQSRPVDERVRGSGGGAEVEAMFWVKEAMVQWRIRGKAYVLAPEDFGVARAGAGAGSQKEAEGKGAGPETAKTILARMRRLQPADGGGGARDASSDWTFRREISAHFGNLSPGMRGTWKNPPSGAPVSVAPSDDRLKLGQKSDSLEADDLARQNFRVVVILPEFVDRCDLSDPARGRRWFYTFLGSGGGGGVGGQQQQQQQSKTPGGQIEGEWEKVEVWP